MDAPARIEVVSSYILDSEFFVKIFSGCAFARCSAFRLQPRGKLAMEGVTGKHDPLDSKVTLISAETRPRDKSPILKVYDKGDLRFPKVL